MILTEDKQHILNHTAGVWPELKGKTIFLTGGTGFFGKWLLESFLYANEQLGAGMNMIVLSRNPKDFLLKYPHFRNPAIQYYAAEVREFHFPPEQIDYIIHAASDFSAEMNAERPLDVFDTIVEGTRQLLELARVKGVKSILHTSSGAVYGRQPSDVTHLPEDFAGAQDVYDRNASYGEGKRVAEMLAGIYFSKFGVPSKIARCFAFTGPYLPLDGGYAIGNFIRDAADGDKIVVKGDGTPYRSYMYASDLAIWLWNILVFGKPCRPYNVGSDEDLTIGALAKKVAAYGKNGICNVEIQMPESGLPAARYVPDVKRAKEELNLNVYVGLDEAIRNTIDFYKK